MIKAKNKGFEVQNIHKCRNYNWSKDKTKHCGIVYSESFKKPINAFIKFSNCSLDDNKSCNYYNCGVQIIERNYK